ncbi:DUF2312 domain-containing protein [Rhodobacter sp. KR11]|uniref:DUF2312 domain-containing protein n=1 Tax=Rhodobacter sp. KR11 TaxID=2974588 RepID=UPI002223C4D6|nr:DUF2312 domain-containing protein [Rhodobacter sp. KR11]MCW1920840.1 DUF2312 domain-containing protein [Rhodobacter sp. KR11]
MDAETPRGSNMIEGERLRAFVEKIEQARSEKKVAADLEKAILAEAKSVGYAPKYLAAIVRLRAKPPSEREEDQAMMELYMAAVGMARETPLFRAVEGMGVDVAAKESILDALKLLAPVDGEITIKVGSAPRMRLWRDKEGVRMEEVPDTPAPSSAAPGPTPSAARARPGDDAPDCSPGEAFDLGREARRDDKPVIANPFAWDDPRRRRWDEGWRAEDGGDGMGPR